MKELTIEQKAKAYDGAIEKARLVLQEKGNEPDGASILSELFPELIESEDERIRKGIIGYLKSNFDTCICDDWIAWLEKQGEQKVIIPQFRVGETIKYKECIYPYQTIEEIGNYGYKLRDCYTNTSSTVPFDKENEFELVEQKPTDKIEPKFKVGDWVVTSYGKVNQVIAVDGDGFTLDDDTYFSGSWKDNYHLWTIQDAKDGDVLSYSDSRHTWLCIFKELKNQRCYDYCSYRNKDEIGFWPRSNWNYDKTLSYKPATKEQRNLLFQKMKEAGYEWDSEKKELKKIEQKSIEWNEKIKGLDELETYVLSLVPDRPLDAVKVDSKNIRFLINKEQKSSWSEEDEKMFNKLLAVIALYYGYSGNVLDKQSCTSFLKSLKDRYTWEPSEEQMDALRYVINFDYGGHKATLVSLYEQLKKLK